MFKLVMENRTDGNRIERLGDIDGLQDLAQANMDRFYILSIEPATYNDMQEHVEELEKELSWAQLSLENCSWETGDKHRRNVDHIKHKISKWNKIISDTAEARLEGAV